MNKKSKNIDELDSYTIADIEVLLNCSVHVVTKIIADVRKIMIDKGMITLMTTVLTKYLILYLEDNNIDY